jgi:hypothetical protein
LAFLRFSRDKRGVENFYLVQPTTNRRGKVRQRVLYWFRSPPDVKVGREPFDQHARRALEAQNPEVEFDWRAIVDTPIPSAEADKWRERRRAERAAKHAAAEASVEPVGDEDGEADVPDAAAPQDNPMAAASEDAAVLTSLPATPGHSVPRSVDANRKRRRRRRSGGGRDRAAGAAFVTPPAARSSDPTGD